ncbi:hypothetical protein [Fodinicola acaciae]|uniref:hypothetical protein n=1 Tax=Fodinicola acaciae TaxID=2681555 RepID=UPI0013D05CF4|nr:hypothetical protein [Fodinicola acaciae]
MDGWPVDCTFSEFSYGYAAIREAETDLAALHEPITLVADEQCVDYVLLLQFRRVDYVSRRHPASPTWKHVGRRHYRFAVDTGSAHHRALLELAAKLPRGEVYYSAPLFHTDREFDYFYSHDQVLAHSSLVRPSEFGVGDGIHHHVTDQTGTRTTWDEIVRRHGEVAGERITVRELADLMEASVDTMGRGRTLDESLPTGIAQRLQRLAALLDCGLVLFVSSPVPHPV